MKDQIICSVIAIAGAYLFFISPILDSRNEPRLAAAYGRSAPQIQLVQSFNYERKLQEQIEQQQEELRREVERQQREPQYIWTPDGRLQGWQQPDDRGQTQQYDLDGHWKGTIYK